MSEVVNLRTARKRAKRQDDEKRAHANRLAHGLPPREQALDRARRNKADHDLTLHLIDAGDGR